MSAQRRPFLEARDDALARWCGAPSASAFSHPDVCAAAAETAGLDLAVWACGDAALMAFEKRGPLCLRVLAMPPLLPVTAPILGSPPTEAQSHAGGTDLARLLDAVGAHYAQATLSLPHAWPDARPFAWAGWRVEARAGYVLDLPTAPEAWSKGRRQDARADGFEVRLDADGPELAARFQAGAYARKGVPLAETEAQMTRVARAAAGAGLLRTASVWRDGEAEAAALFVVRGDHATYWLAGSAPGPAMAVLFAHATAALAADGIATLDLGGANVPGVAEFKRQFGACLVPALRVRHVGPRWLRVANALRGA